MSHMAQCMSIGEWGSVENPQRPVESMDVSRWRASSVFFHLFFSSVPDESWWFPYGSPYAPEPGSKRATASREHLDLEPTW